MKLKSRKKDILFIFIILIIQTTVFIIAGINKSYIHMDEAYSLGLASYNKTNIQQNEDFYNTWHTKEYYEDYLSVNKDEIGNYKPVYENQKNDVHPPLYYLLLRIAMGFHIDSYSKWPGLILNIIIYMFISIFTYLIISKLLEKRNNCKEKAAILTLISSLTLSSINNAMYIRMYALSTLNILITTYLHFKLLDSKGKSYKLLLLIGISALMGSLTHYYYLFYLAILFIMFVIKYIKEKEYVELAKYILTISLVAVISLIIFPYSIQHIFFGYRGQGALSNLTNTLEALKHLAVYMLIIDVDAFNNTLLIILSLILGILIYRKLRKCSKINEKNKYVKYVAVPTIFYTVLAAICSPWLELRYIMPVCSLLFILAIYLIIQLLDNVVKEKTANKILIIILLLVFTMPFVANKFVDLVIGEDFRKEKESSYSSKEEIVQKLKSELNVPIDIFPNIKEVPIDNTLLFIKNLKIEPEVIYSNKKDITEFIENNANLPALYLLNSSNDRFLDEILLFSILNESYIAKDIEYSEENIKSIMINKDISNGIIVFINDIQENEKIINTIQKALKLENVTYLKRLNMCDVYLVN